MRGFVHVRTWTILGSACFGRGGTIELGAENLFQERPQSVRSLANDVARELGELGPSGQARLRNGGQLA